LEARINQLTKMRAEKNKVQPMKGRKGTRERREIYHR